jgi:hypothetical protein
MDLQRVLESPKLEAMLSQELAKGSPPLWAKLSHQLFPSEISREIFVHHLSPHGQSQAFLRQFCNQSKWSAQDLAIRLHEAGKTHLAKALLSEIGRHNVPTSPTLATVPMLELTPPLETQLPALSWTLEADAQRSTALRDEFKNVLPSDWQGSILDLLNFLVKSPSLKERLLDFLKHLRVLPAALAPSSAKRPVLAFPVRRNGLREVITFSEATSLDELRDRLSRHFHIPLSRLRLTRRMYTGSKPTNDILADEEELWQRFYRGQISVLDPIYVSSYDEPPLGDKCEKCTTPRLTSLKCEKCGHSPL